MRKSKACTMCGVDRVLAEFSKNASAKDGLQHRCKSCFKTSAAALPAKSLARKRETTRKWREDNRERARETSRKWREDNLERERESSRRWGRDNLSRVRETTRKWAAENPGRRRANIANYRAAKMKRTPQWADLKAIKAFYIACPEGYQVDHIVPLQGKNVSGLHILSNLQYLTPRENQSKGNSFNPDASSGYLSLLDFRTSSATIG